MVKLYQLFIYCLFIIIIFSANTFANENDLSFKNDNCYKEIVNGLEKRKLTLNIYYIPYHILTDKPITKENIIKNYYYKITLNPSALYSYQNDLKQIGECIFEKIEIPPKIDLRVYVEIKIKDEIMFTFGMGFSEYMLINGEVVKTDMKPFSGVFRFLPDSGK